MDDLKCFNKFLFLHQTSNWDISYLHLKDKYSMVYTNLPVSRWDVQNDILDIDLLDIQCHKNTKDSTL